MIVNHSKGQVNPKIRDNKAKFTWFKEPFIKFSKKRFKFIFHPIRTIKKYKAKLIFFITPAILTGVISHFSILLLFLFEIVYPDAQTIKGIESYINSGSAISAAIAVIITTVITHLFNPKFSLNLSSLRMISFTILSVLIVVLGLINMMLINFTVSPKILSIDSLNTFKVSIATCILALIITYISFKFNYEPDAAKQYLDAQSKNQEQFQNDIKKEEVDDKYADD